MRTQPWSVNRICQLISVGILVRMSERQIWFSRVTSKSKSLALAVLVLGVVLPSCARFNGTKQKPYAPSTSGLNPSEFANLKIEDIEIGTGDTAVAGKNITVLYTGYLLNGTEFDSRMDRNQPFHSQLGTGQLIKGWDIGVQGMKVGGIRNLTIPSELAYGHNGAGNVIPADATLVFKIELLKVE